MSGSRTPGEFYEADLDAAQLRMRALVATLWVVGSANDIGNDTFNDWI